jgi:uncharacterized protein (DUF983 family)
MPARSSRSFFAALSRGVRLRCPRCGEGQLFASWNHLLETCPVCGLDFERRLGDTWFFMYMSTAGLSGALVVAMFLIRPRVVWIGQILVCLAIAVIGFSLPYRKGIAVALDYWVEGDDSGDGAAPGV